MTRPGMRRLLPRLLTTCGLAVFAMTGAGCSPVRVRTQCLYLPAPTPAQQAGAAAEMEAHPELPNIRLQARNLDYALRENAACWGKKVSVETR